MCIQRNYLRRVLCYMYFTDVLALFSLLLPNVTMPMWFVDETLRRDFLSLRTLNTLL